MVGYSKIQPIRLIIVGQCFAIKDDRALDKINHFQQHRVKNKYHLTANFLISGLSWWKNLSFSACHPSLKPIGTDHIHTIGKYVQVTTSKKNNIGLRCWFSFLTAPVSLNCLSYRFYFLIIPFSSFRLFYFWIYISSTYFIHFSYLHAYYVYVRQAEMIQVHISRELSSAISILNSTYSELGTHKCAKHHA